MSFSAPVAHGEDGVVVHQVHAQRLPGEAHLPRHPNRVTESDGIMGMRHALALDTWTIPHQTINPTELYYTNRIDYVSIRWPYHESTDALVGARQVLGTEARAVHVLEEHLELPIHTPPQQTHWLSPAQGEAHTNM